MKKDKHVNRLTEQSNQPDAERAACYSTAYLSGQANDQVNGQMNSQVNSQMNSQMKNQMNGQMNDKVTADGHVVDRPSQSDKTSFLLNRSQSSNDQQSSQSNHQSNYQSNDHKSNQHSHHDHKSNSQSNHQSGSPELCEKIRSSLGHFTEEFKEKFIKKKNRSPNLFANRRNEDRSNNSSDQEELETRPQARSITRIKINASEENDFSTPNSSQNTFGQSTYQNSQSTGQSTGQNSLSAYPNSQNYSQSNSLSQCSQQCSSISQNSLFESTRSPFVNRALPPLPKKQQDDGQPFARSYSNLKASNSRSDDDRSLQARNESSPDERPFSKSTQKFNPRRSSEKAGKFSNATNQVQSSHSNHSSHLNHSSHSNHSGHSNHSNAFGNHSSHSRFSPDSDPDEDDEQILTNCFKFNRENRDQLKRCSAKIKNEIKQHFLPKKFAHPPPHLHSKKKVVQLFDYDDEEEEEDYEESPAGQPPGSSLTNLPNSSGNFNSSGTFNSSDNFSSPNNADQPLKESCSNQLNDETRKMMDYAESIEKVKDCGWYWGSISGEKAEKLLENEPEGSFIVRDSSDENYIFSLTFKLNGDIIHVRIEHNQGNFSFGSFQKFKSKTIVDFIQDAVEYSRSGRYLFFLHRLPVVGPMRVQLLNPVSRFRNVQSLRHLCRFVILKHVRRDLLPNLPLPDRLIKYLNATNYFVESSSFA